MEDSKSETSEVVSNSDYIDAIKDLKQNTVSKSDYEALKADNKKLLDTLINGSNVESKESAKPKYDVKQLRKDLFGDKAQDLDNLTYITKSLQLRDAIIDEGGVDPFLPTGKKIVPTTEDVQCAERVAKVFQECIDYAQGDSEAFTNELQRRTIDVGPSLPRKRV